MNRKDKERKLLLLREKKRRDTSIKINDVYFKWKPQPRQNIFLNACGIRPNGNKEEHNPIAQVIGFGGAAGGGKSDALLGLAGIIALKYPKVNIGYFRRKYVELEGLGGPIDRSRQLYTDIATYNGTEHCWTFPNKSKVKFCHLQTESDVYSYQSQQFDVILFDEGTQFTRFQYRYMLSRNRATIDYFKPFMGIATNPGNVGNGWFKDEFVNIGTPETPYKVEVEEEKFEYHVFIPSKLTDNKILMERDPEYEKKLDALPEDQRRMLKDGDFDVFAGQYFSEFRKAIHVVEPFEIPDYWRKYVTLDYGLDMLACYWIAMDEQNNAYVYKELYESGLIISEASKRILEVNNGDKIYTFYAPPDLWNKRQETGKSAADIYAENGIDLIQSDNNRVQGWYNVKEWLKPYNTRNEQTGEEKITASLKMFNNCINLIRCLPLLQHDEKNPNDVSNEPHELTHGPDAIRGFCSTRPSPSIKPVNPKPKKLIEKLNKNKGRW